MDITDIILLLKSARCLHGSVPPFKREDRFWDGELLTGRKDCGFAMMQCSRLRSLGNLRRIMLLQESGGGGQRDYNWSRQQRGEPSPGSWSALPRSGAVKRVGAVLMHRLQRRDTDEMHLDHLLVHSTESPASVGLVKSSADATHSSLGCENILTFYNKDSEIDSRTFVLIFRRRR
jgi:hypothetical protein